MSDWQDAEHHAEKAQDLFEAGEWDAALRELRAALSVNPQQTQWLFDMGLALDALRRYDEAAEVFESVLRLRGDNVETLLHLGADLIRSGQPRRAVGVLERAAELDPQCEPSYCQRVAAYAQLEDHDQAEVMFYLARQLTDECPDCLDHLGHSLAMRDQMDRAVWCWQQVLRLDPDHPGVPGSLARAYWQLDQYELARHYIEQQARDEPDDAEPLMTAGILLIEMGKTDEAGEKFRRALDLDPTLPDAHLYLGELSMLRGHVEAAAARFQRARQLDPDMAAASAGLAQVALHRKDKAAARAYLEEELALAQRSPAQAIDLSRMLIEADMSDEAVRVLDPLVAELAAVSAGAHHSQMLTDALLCRGAARMIDGDLTGGIADTRQAVALDPTNPVAMHNLALAYLESGRLSRAGYWLHRAIELAPQDRQLRKARRRVSIRGAIAAARRRLPPWR